MYSAPPLERTQDLDPEQFSNLAELFDHAFKSWGDRPAFTCMGHSISYRELDEASTHLAAWLRENSGLEPGDRIAIQLPNLLQFPVAVVAAARAGLVIVNTNPLYTAREMKHQFRDSGAKGIVILANFAEKLQSILPETEIKSVIVTELGDMLPGLKGKITNFVIKHVKKMVPAYSLPEAKTWKQVFSANTTVDGREHIDPGTDVAIILYTGGTTGPSKGAMLTHSNLLWNMMQLRSASKGLINDGEDNIVAPLPLYHTYAFMLHVLSQTYAGNNNVLIPNPRDVDGLIKTLKGIKVNGIVGINTLYLAMCKTKAINDVDFSDMRFSGAGGMAMSVSVAKEWEEITGSPVSEGYGLTECSPVVTVNPHEKIKLGTVGKPVPETSVKLMDEEGNEVPAGERGELWVKGPQVMKGYWQNDKATADSIQDGWFKTGDYATIDEEGYIKIVDRKKDMIIVSGFNVFPSEVEEVVNSHPGVSESAAIGIPDEKSGETIKLFVVKRDDGVSAKDVEAHCRENLTAYKVPKEIVFSDDLPKSNVGKILRRELREQELAKSK